MMKGEGGDARATGYETAGACACPGVPRLRFGFCFAANWVMFCGMSESVEPTSSPSAGGQEYKVQLEQYSGPLELLLYLIRRDEVDIKDIPIARITEQYLKHVDIIRRFDINYAGEFLVMAATL